MQICLSRILPFAVISCIPTRTKPGYSHPFVNLLWESPYSVPIPLEYTLNPLSLELHDNCLACNLTLYEGTLKYFYPDYQNYYYLPLEDTAIHKSIGEYVDRSARKKATAKNCYSKKEGLFLPQFGSLWEPSFKEEYKSSLTYTLYDDKTLWNDTVKILTMPMRSLTI